MNLQQLEYIVSVDKHRHFAKASKACFVTQPTLSMMIQKLELELNIILFDRSKQPVVPTESGREIIKQARKVLNEYAEIIELAATLKGELKGDLKVGIIPTVAPYLLPIFLKQFLKKYDKIKLKISEHTTESIIEKLKKGILDVGILATPLNDPAILEKRIYKEEFLVYASSGEKVLGKKYLLAEDIDINHLWLLQEGHCLRSQIVNLCELKKLDSENNNLEYEAGSIESLIRMVDQNSGITIVPELATHHLSKKQKNNLRHFKDPVPVREISIVTYRRFIKSRMLEALRMEIINSVNNKIVMNKNQNVIKI